MGFSAQILLSSFVMIFLAEMGDKTQLSTFAFASETQSSLSVFLGASLALVCTTALGVALGGLVGKFVPARLVKFLSAAIFLGFGAYTLWEGIRGKS